MNRRPPLLRDQGGATAAEFALLLPIFLLFLLGMIDVGRYSWSVNQSEKATQIGARWAVVTDLVPADLKFYSFAVHGGIPQGTVIGTDKFGSIVCTSTSGTVGCTATCTASCDWDTDFIDDVAFARIVRRMQLIYPAIGADNVEVTYTNSGLGFSGDPNGPDVSPLVTVRLRNMSFPMLFMLGRRVQMPSFSYTQTLEDADGTISN